MSRPNVLFILSDQHRYATLPGVDGCEVIAPNLDRLAREGAFFRQNWSCHPICSPARAMMISGRWPTDTGVTFNDYELYTEPTSLGSVFEDAGYHTAYVGKWHLHEGPKENVDNNDHYIPPGPGRHGFSWMRLWNSTNKHWDAYWYSDPEGDKVPYDGYNPVGMTDQVLEFLDGEWNRDQPFFLTLSVNPPHDPMHDSPPRFRELYDADEIKLRPNVSDAYANGETIPPVHGGTKLSLHIREQLAHYYGHVSAIDNEIGRVLDKLDEMDISDDTCVIYTSDHGDMMGSHDLIRKPYMYSEATQVPLYVRHPGHITPGTVTDGLVSTIDIYPTLLGLADIPVPERARGMNLSHLATGSNGDDRDHVLHFYTWPEDRTMSRLGLWGIRTQEWLLYETDERHLHDLIADPFEMENLAGRPQYAEIEADLQRRLDEAKFA
jgi:arylsulfatase A-like enzyme